MRGCFYASLQLSICNWELSVVTYVVRHNEIGRVRTSFPLGKASYWSMVGSSTPHFFSLNSFKIQSGVWVCISFSFFINLCNFLLIICIINILNWIGLNYGDEMKEEWGRTWMKFHFWGMDNDCSSNFPWFRKQLLKPYFNSSPVLPEAKDQTKVVWRRSRRGKKEMSSRVEVN